MLPGAPTAGTLRLATQGFVVSRFRVTCGQYREVGESPLLP
jgi:hypothetical protein